MPVFVLMVRAHGAKLSPGITAYTLAVSALSKFALIKPIYRLGLDLFYYERAKSRKKRDSNVERIWKRSSEDRLPDQRGARSNRIGSCDQRILLGAAYALGFTLLTGRGCKPVRRKQIGLNQYTRT